MSEQISQSLNDYCNEIPTDFLQSTQYKIIYCSDNQGNIIFERKTTLQKDEENKNNDIFTNPHKQSMKERRRELEAQYYTFNPVL